ncbi:MAG: mucoidy inhibitor MuiA family protein [Anaerolineales bacterium]
MDTKTIAVTVFPDRARVTRAGHVRLKQGVQKLAVAQLPLALQPDSVRASGQGFARVKLLGVSASLEYFVDTPAEAARNLENRIQAGEDADADLLARISVLEKEQKYLEGLAAQSEMYARGLALRDRTTEEQGAIFDFIGGRMQAIQTEILQATRQRREKAKELEQLRRELKQIQSARPTQRYLVVVEVDVLTPGPFDLELTYVVMGAGWKPLYDLRLQAGGLDLTYLAQVTQNTGEDWNDVKLTLSTAQPSLALVIPELQPWYIQPRVYPPPQAMRAAAPKSRGLAADMAFGAMEEAPMPSAAPGAAPEPELLAVDSAEVSESGAALTYLLPARADIPGNNDPRKVTVAVFNLPPALDYVTAPKQEQVCYRRAKLKNDSPYTLLPGAAQLFEGDEYLGATRLAFIAPAQEFELALGADERLRVERKLALREVDKAFSLSDRRRLRYAYTIEVENLRDAPQTVLVRDQLPVARDEQIKIKLESAEPKPTEQTDLRLLEWQLTIKEKSKQKIRFEFSVEAPRAMELQGLVE